MIPKAFIELVENKVDIANLIGSYVELIPKGNNLVGVCPFDGGVKPMFTVSTDKRIWKCFKCGKGGAAVRFVMEIEKLSFPNAIHFLAEKLELELPEDEL